MIALSQVYRYGLKLWISLEFLMLKLVLLNEGESKRKLQKIYAGKNLRMIQKSFTKKLLI